MGDHSLMSWTPKRLGNFPQAEPSSAGICRSVRDDVIVAPFNDAEMAASLIHEHRNELAAVIVEPFQRLLPPKPGFLQALRKATQDAGVLLIFDEIVTGFRFAYGGAQEYYGVVPDLCTLGKIIGGGFPLAAIAGPAEIMGLFDRAKAGEDRFLPRSARYRQSDGGRGRLGNAGGVETSRRVSAGFRHRPQTDGHAVGPAARHRPTRPGDRRAGTVRRVLRHRRHPRLPRHAAPPTPT